MQNPRGAGELLEVHEAGCKGNLNDNRKKKTFHGERITFALESPERSDDAMDS